VGGSLLLTVVLLAGCGSSGGGSAASTSTTGIPAGRAATQVPSVAPGSTLLATFHTDTPSSTGPGEAATGVVPASWHGAPSVLPVIASRDNWIDVRLAQRPNGSTAWVPATSVSYSSTPYRIVVSLASTHLELFRANKLVLSAPAGVGVPQSPTPTGAYFLAFLAQPASAGYGPFVMVTSAHSNAITDFEESGDAMIAIHGPLGAGAAIGTTGARVSHGCVRLQLTDLAQLRVVPVGSPVTIVAG
jgi:lipoprotein-anchoring transpeptidase ErfK/SrfK